MVLTAVHAPGAGRVRGDALGDARRSVAPLPFGDERFLRQRCRGASLDARTARDAFRIEEALPVARRDL